MEETMTEEATSSWEDSLIGASEAVPNFSSAEENSALDLVSQQEKLRQNSDLPVRKQVIRMLVHDYCISIKDITVGFAVHVNGHQRILDIAVFNKGEPHVERSLSRIIIFHEEKRTEKSLRVLRDFDQAEKDLYELKMLMTEFPSCKYGLWTNGLETFYLEKSVSTLDIQINPIGDWPPSEALPQAQNVLSKIYTYKADPELLQITIRRCKIFLRGNEGMPINSTFWQLLYLFFCKIYDESVQQNKRRFWVGLREQFEIAGRKQIRKRILSLFQEVKDNYKVIFRGNEEITLSDYALAFIVSELARYDFANSSLSAKEVAFQEIAELILRAERGQYLTPKYIVQFLIAMLDPDEQERIFDPACGTGGFLIETQKYISGKKIQKSDISSNKEEDVFQKTNKIHLKSSSCRTFGADIDPFLVKVAQMHMALLGFGEENLYQINSLTFPHESIVDAERAKHELRLGTFDVLITNPPFSSITPISDKNSLSQFELAHIWKKKDEGGFIKTGELHKSIPVEIIFIERSLEWLKLGGRLGIVLPTSILSSSIYEYVRWWILQKAWILAIVDLPAEAFSSTINAKILTSLFFLQKKTAEETHQEILQGETEYPVFVALAETIGIDSRGKKLYRNQSNDKELLTEKNVKRELRGEKKTLDNDLPVIVQKYKEFLVQQANSDKLPYTVRKD
jgi:type I restriction enzyme M protein